MIRNKYLYVVLVVMSVLASCSPDDRMGLEEPIQDLKIIVIPGEKPNTYTFKTTPADVIGFWDLGNGVVADGVSSVTGEFPFPGNYSVTLKAFGQGGQTKFRFYCTSCDKEQL